MVAEVGEPTMRVVVNRTVRCDYAGFETNKEKKDLEEIALEENRNSLNEGRCWMRG
jgi:hypothetical protein